MPKPTKFFKKAKQIYTDMLFINLIRINVLTVNRELEFSKSIERKKMEIE